jgi:hypothetical protein
MARYSEVALRRSCDVNYIRTRLAYKIIQIRERGRDRKSFAYLLRHQFFPVTGTDHLTARNSLDLRRVGVGDFSASDDCYFKHVATSSDSFRKRE